MGTGLANDMVTLGLFDSVEAAIGGIVDLTPSGRLEQWRTWPMPSSSSRRTQSKFINGVGLPVDGGMGM